ncbi:uncharacterized protein LOC143448642 [Clavelina lepadiformis]|uniref:Cytochrome c oxidase assembly protein COX20, mitochondrial n=1 Tax=Clavelina lepadiformis TaxID=159417 RepID=A0ABP0H2J5_CLALP
MGIFDQLYQSLKNDCVREPIIHGTAAATVASLVHFLYRGTRKSLLVWIGVLWPVAVGSSMYCDYSRIHEQLKNEQYKDALKYQIVNEGTDTNKPFSPRKGY